MKEGITIDNDMDLDITFVKNKNDNYIHIQVVEYQYTVHSKKCFKQFAICCLHQFEGLYQPSGIQSIWTSEGLLVLSADTNPDPDSRQLRLLCPLILIF